MNYFTDVNLHIDTTINKIPLQYSCLENPMDRGAWWAAVHGVAKSRTGLSDFTFTFHFHALEEEMATHSSVLAWRIPGKGEPGGLPSMGSYRVTQSCTGDTTDATEQQQHTRNHSIHSTGFCIYLQIILCFGGKDFALLFTFGLLYILLSEIRWFRICQRGVVFFGSWLYAAQI